jgi:hypothetical protein
MNLSNDNLAVTSVSASTYYNLPGLQTTVEVTSIIYQSPTEIITVINKPLPNASSPPVVYVRKNQVITPPPIHTNKYFGYTTQMIYGRICGGNENYGNSKYVNCTRCVDKFLNDNPDKRSPMDLTSKGTGCKFG